MLSLGDESWLVEAADVIIAFLCLAGVAFLVVLELVVVPFEVSLGGCSHEIFINLWLLLNSRKVGSSITVRILRIIQQVQYPDRLLLI